MNKKQLKDGVYKLNRYDVQNKLFNFMSITTVSLSEVLGLIDQLDEPEKVTIPQEAADWIESVRNLSKSMSCLMTYDQIKRFSYELTLWCYESGNNDNLHKLARAWLDGYEVEKEPLYYAKSKVSTLLNWDNDGEDYFATLGDSSDETVFLFDRYDNEGLIKTLAEWNRLGIDETIAIFVPVEETP